MVFKKKILVFILIIAFLLGPFTYRANATDWVAGVRWSVDTVMKIVAQSAFKVTSTRILNKIRSAGIDGGPAFVQNWRNFQLESQYRGEDIWRGLLYIAAKGEGNTPPLLCKHIRESQAFNSLRPTRVNNLIQGLGPNRRINDFQEYLVATRCDPVVNEKFDTFMQDFSAGGGWDTFERLLQPQNNIYGAIELALKELDKQRSIEEKSSINQILAGQGYTAVSDCLVKGPTGICLIPDKIKTPGSTLKESVASIFDTSLKFYTSADAASGALAFVFNFVFDKLFDLVGDGGGDGGTIARTNEESYKNEFCTAGSSIAWEAVRYIEKNYPKALPGWGIKKEFNPENVYNNNPGADDAGDSWCEQFREKKNYFPYERCTRACYKAVGLVPPDVSVPDFTATPPPSPSEPEPGPEPGPGPGPGLPPIQPASLLSDVRAERAKYGNTTTAEETSRILNAVAWKNRDAGWGLLNKPSGTNCPFGFGPDLRPITIACDILFHAPTGLHFDALIDGGQGGTSEPTWRLVGPIDLSRWLAPIQP